MPEFYVIFARKNIQSRTKSRVLQKLRKKIRLDILNKVVCVLVLLAAITIECETISRPLSVINKCKFKVVQGQVTSGKRGGNIYL